MAETIAMKKITKSAAIALLDGGNVSYSSGKISLEKLEMNLETWEPEQTNGTMYAENGLRMIRIYEDEEGRERRSDLTLAGKENTCYEYTNPNGVHSIICDCGFVVIVYTIIEGPPFTADKVPISESQRTISLVIYNCYVIEKMSLKRKREK